MNNLENVPPHELRRRWLTAITSTFPEIITWHAANDRQHRIVGRNRRLVQELSNLARLVASDDYWTFPVLASWLNKWHGMHEFVILQYQCIKDNLVPAQVPWERCSQRYRETIVKRMVILHTYVRILVKIFELVFEHIDAIVKRPKELQALRTQPVSRMTRRWSASDIGHQTAQTVRNRWLVERNILATTRLLDAMMTEELLEVTKRYNAGASFRDYYEWVICSNELKKDWCRFMGEKYKYPRKMWMMHEENKKEGKEDSEIPPPIYGVVPKYEEDRELLRLFH